MTAGRPFPVYMFRSDCTMCVQLQEGGVSVSIATRTAVVMFVCVWTFQCVSLDKWSPTFGRTVLPSSWTVKVIVVDPDSWNENTAILRNVGVDDPTDVASLLRRLSFVSVVLCTVSNTGLWCRCLLESTEFVVVPVGTAVLHKKLLG
jgi:hypothetical protein